MKLSRCKRCRRPVVWLRTTRGKRIPLDEQPDPRGRWLVDLDASPVPIATYLDRFDLELHRHQRPDVPRYRCHLDTCPVPDPRRKDDDA